jgi:predicted regulator of Ras-like GTPase activity (Roadblock/LC7/MglB family)
MSFAQLFWILSATSAVLFFCAGLAAGTLKSQRARQMDQIEIARLNTLIVELERRTGSTNSSLPPTELEHRMGNANWSLAPAAMDAVDGTKTFQSILERLSMTKGIRAAVLGDAMGLPVAAIGDQSESLAGFCGFISQAASKARDFLQLGSIRRIVIEDERMTTLTACSVPGTDIFLATLTAGPGPDVPGMVQLLNDVQSFMSQRSQA